MSRPKNSTTGQMKAFNIRLPEKVYTMLQDECKITGMNISALIRQIVMTRKK